MTHSAHDQQDWRRQPRQGDSCGEEANRVVPGSLLSLGQPRKCPGERCGDNTSRGNASKGTRVSGAEFFGHPPHQRPSSRQHRPYPAGKKGRRRDLNYQKLITRHDDRRTTRSLGWVADYTRSRGGRSAEAGLTLMGGTIDRASPRSRDVNCRLPRDLVDTPSGQDHDARPP